ncbi:hypothetical protein [Algoriphagus halophilus]|uniref:Septum formation inhibitor Maf n=1 Tax=Algoriphagus halophilus TaxID=226505 RepID=A0A1N6DBE1_9BACT|nr:hypothetical protein [Algoriphagus halophilus]SIN67974.1 hypothetical protein SAMN05444394_0630 [Algoriphagus halophilus]
MRQLAIFFSFIMLFGCGVNPRSGIDENQFSNYWYQGKAEINVFDLEQYRYGEKREGEAVMIFVTEDFSRRKQVKLDNPEDAGADARKVLKMNMTREFVTGIYPYHTMLSAFTPVYDEENAFKITASVTEWCGQSFTQLNWKNGSYKARLFSYFESEGDQELSLDGAAEDELFNTIRLNPSIVPEGDVRLIPSLIFQRFSHVPLKVERASISKRDVSGNQAEITVEYKSINRKVSVRYQKFFPFEILSWEEIQTKENGEVERTIGTRKSMEMLDYWNRNGSEDEELRRALGL